VPESAQESAPCASPGRRLSASPRRTCSGLDAVCRPRHQRPLTVHRAPPDLEWGLVGRSGPADNRPGLDAPVGGPTRDFKATSIHAARRGARIRRRNGCFIYRGPPRLTVVGGGATAVGAASFFGAPAGVPFVRTSCGLRHRQSARRVFPLGGRTFAASPACFALLADPGRADQYGHSPQLRLRASHVGPMTAECSHLPKRADRPRCWVRDRASAHRSGRSPVSTHRQPCCSTPPLWPHWSAQLLREWPRH